MQPYRQRPHRKGRCAFQRTVRLCRHIRGVPRAQMRYSPFATAQFNERSSAIATPPQSSVATANAIRRRLPRVGLRLKCMFTTYAHLSQLSMRCRAHPACAWGRRTGLDHAQPRRRGLAIPARYRTWEEVRNTSSSRAILALETPPAIFASVMGSMMPARGARCFPPRC